jgi:hypothetical protein
MKATVAAKIAMPEARAWAPLKVKAPKVIVLSPAVTASAAAVFEDLMT